MTLRRCFALVILVATLGAPLASHAAATPMERVRSTVEEILELLRDRDLSLGDKQEKISSIVRARFSFRAISQRVLGKNWKKASKEQQKRFEERFSQLLESTYIGRVEAYSDETVRYDGEEIRGKRATVDTTVVTKTAEIPIQYKMALLRDTWQVYDVVIEGISLVSNYRNTYDEIVRREGIEGLLEKMEAKIQELAEGDPDGRE